MTAPEGYLSRLINKLNHPWTNTQVLGPMVRKGHSLLQRHSSPAPAPWPMPEIDAEFGWQPPEKTWERPDTQAFSRLLHNQYAPHTSWVMTGYTLRVGPPQSHEVMALARAVEVEWMHNRPALNAELERTQAPDKQP
ncbi:hypothetical protein [Pseudomonas protegens]|uniref:hypothetical protein n=1 Tax=Pseudomonas protegens TaxID=380021 RepID=UPI00383A8584